MVIENERLTEAISFLKKTVMKIEARENYTKEHLKRASKLHTVITKVSEKSYLYTVYKDTWRGKKMIYKTRIKPLYFDFIKRELKHR